jgi:hypothetical protein
MKPIIRIGIQTEPPERWIGPICRPPTASAIPSAIANSSTGKAQSTSIAREITESVQPR